MSNYSVDIAIIGGGIAGLWTLARLIQDGYQAVLLEADSLGSMQTGASQGIIHGGTKYALTGKLTHSAQSICQMPQRWKDCLQGHGEVDLSQAVRLSEHQYLWSNKSIASRLTGFFASKVMSSRMQRLKRTDYMPPFNSQDFQGEVYQLDEPVLDIKTVMEAIRTQYAEKVLHFKVQNISKLPSGGGYCIKAENSASELSARTLILTAGVANKALLDRLGMDKPDMQRRPLLMPMLKASEMVLPRLYAHCLGVSALPKMTITSHSLGDGQMVWYLGGEIAEQGVGKSAQQQIRAAKKELHKLMPWRDFSTCEWSVLPIDRAEPKMPDGSRPAEPAVFMQDGIISAWPVKLAMAPLMVDKIVQQLIQSAIQPADADIEQAGNLPVEYARTSELPWEKVQTWLS